MLAIAKKTVAGCAPESILKAEICAMVCDDSDVWQAAVYDDQVFDSAWLAAVGTGDSVGTGVGSDSSRDTAHRLSFSPHQQIEFQDVQGNSDVQQGPMPRPVSILKKSTDDAEQQQQKMGRDKISLAIAQILREDANLMPDPDAPPLQKLQHLLTLKELAAAKMRFYYP